MPRYEDPRTLALRAVHSLAGFGLTSPWKRRRSLTVGRCVSAKLSAAPVYFSTQSKKNRVTKSGRSTNVSSTKPVPHAVQAPISTDKVSSNLSIATRECARVLKSLRSHSFAWRASVRCLAALHCVWTMLISRPVCEAVTYSRMIAWKSVS